MMKGIKSSAAVALFATAARAAEEVVQQVAEQAPEAAKEMLTNENAAGYLASALNMISHCPSFVKETLDATVGENPYARGAATLITLAAVAVPSALAFSNYRKNKAAASLKPAKTGSETPKDDTDKSAGLGANAGKSVVGGDSSVGSEAKPSSKPSSSSSGDNSHSGDEIVDGEKKNRSRSPSPSRKGF